MFRYDFPEPRLDPPDDACSCELCLNLELCSDDRCELLHGHICDPLDVEVELADRFEGDDLELDEAA